MSDLKVGDRIMSIDTIKTEFFRDFADEIGNFAGKEVDLFVVRNNNELK
jgi:membrane-associated protease RseP (regulator of RpoE activity)